MRGTLLNLATEFGGGRESKAQIQWLFQCRLAADPDPADEPRGVSGSIKALQGDPDQDRIIRPQLSVTLVHA